VIDINVTSPGQDISLRLIAGLKKRRVHDEALRCGIGQIDKRGFSAMSSSSKYDSDGSSARVKQSVALQPIQSGGKLTLKPRATFDLTDPVQFQ